MATRTHTGTALQVQDPNGIYRSASDSGCRRAQDAKRDVPVNPFALRSATAIMAPAALRACRFATASQARRRLRSTPANGSTPRSDASFVFPLARRRTSGKQSRLAASVDYRPSLRSPWPAAWLGLGYVILVVFGISAGIGAVIGWGIDAGIDNWVIGGAVVGAVILNLELAN